FPRVARIVGRNDEKFALTVLVEQAYAGPYSHRARPAAHLLCPLALPCPPPSLSKPCSALRTMCQASRSDHAGLCLRPVLCQSSAPHHGNVSGCATALRAQFGDISSETRSGSRMSSRLPN